MRLQGQEALRRDLMGLQLIQVFVGQLLLLLQGQFSAHQGARRRRWTGRTGGTATGVLITFAVQGTAITGTTAHGVALAGWPGRASRSSSVVGWRRGQSGDPFSVRFHIDLDVVRMLDVLHESPGWAQAGFARGAHIIAWFCVWAMDSTWKETKWKWRLIFGCIYNGEAATIARTIKPRELHCRRHQHHHRLWASH